jgi:hypothetical protein
MNDSNQYLIEKIDKLVDVVSKNTVLVGRYMEKHDSVQKDLTILNLHVKTIEATVQSQAVTIALHAETHADVKRVKNTVIYGVVTIIIGLTSALVYVVTMAKAAI